MNLPLFYKRYLLHILILMLLFISCQKDSNGEDLGEEDGAFEIFQIMQSIQTEFVRIGKEQNLEPYIALHNVVAFAETLEGVDQAIKIDTGFLHVTTFKGFASSLQIDEVDENGLSLYRGGKNGTSAIKKFRSQQVPDGCVNKIENKKVLLFAAAHDDFYTGDEYQTRIDNLIETSDLDLDVTVLKEEQCTLEVFQSFDQYGMVILDTHGHVDQIQLGVNFTLSPEEIPTTRQDFISVLVDEVGSESALLLINGSLGIGITYIYKRWTPLNQMWDNYDNGNDTEYKLTVKSKGVRSLLPNLDNTIVFANACYSGFNAFTYETSTGRTLRFDPIQPAWMSKNPISFYGYEAANNGVSYIVQNQTAKEMSDSLYRSLFQDKDPTGTAHLFYGTTLYEVPGSTNRKFHRSNNGPLQFKQYGQEDYCYEICENEEDSSFTANIVGLGIEEFEAESFSYNLDPQGEFLQISGRREADGTFLSHSIRLRTFNYRGVGTYSVGAASPSNEDWDALLVIHDNILYSSYDPPSGHVTITEECETFIKGSYSFSARREGTNIEITNGNFVINF